MLVFAAISLLSSQIFCEDELKDLITGVVFVTQDILPQGSLERALEASKDLQHQLARGMDCSEVASWFDSNVVHPKAKVQPTLEQEPASQRTARSETSTTLLMAQLAAEGEDTKRSNATSKLQDRIAARRKRVEDKKAAMGK